MGAETYEVDLNHGGRKIAERKVEGTKKELWRCASRLRVFDAVVNLSDHAMAVMLSNAPQRLSLRLVACDFVTVVDSVSTRMTQDGSGRQCVTCRGTLWHMT
jgi:hypothetical protein